MNDGTFPTRGLHEYRDAPPELDAIYDRLEAHYRSRGIGSGAPLPGRRLKGFGLSNLQGELRTLQGLLSRGPIVLCFIRGHWCPYCRAELAAWKLYRDCLAEVNGRLVVVTAETVRYAHALPDIVGKGTEILCDAHHGLALVMGLAFWCDEDLQKRYHDNGLNFPDIYGSTSGLMTMPAMFVVDVKAIVRYRFANPDFRLRASPSDVVSELEKIA